MIGVNAPRIRFDCAGRIGAEFTSVTTTVKVFVALAMPSVTRVVNVFVLGPSASDVGQEIIPCPLIDAFAGATNNE